jgi:hypothetical protein
MGLWDRIKDLFGDVAENLGGDLLEGDDDERRGRRGKRGEDGAAADDGDDEHDTGRGRRRRDDGFDID